MKTNSRSKEFVRIRTCSTKGFSEAARTLKMTQEHFAFCILSYFGDHPERLRLVSWDPADARKGKQLTRLTPNIATKANALNGVTYDKRFSASAENAATPTQDDCLRSQSLSRQP
jgi:hypothetical protein